MHNAVCNRHHSSSLALPCLCTLVRLSEGQRTVHDALRTHNLGKKWHRKRARAAQAPADTQKAHACLERSEKSMEQGGGVTFREQDILHRPLGNSCEQITNRVRATHFTQPCLFFFSKPPAAKVPQHRLPLSSLCACAAFLLRLLPDPPVL